MKFAWSQYEYLLSLSEKVTQALNYFVKKEYQMALQTLLDTKRTEIAWKTQVMMNLDLHAYSSIDAISFNPLYETYGKECLEVKKKKKRKDTRTPYKYKFIFLDTKQSCL